MNITKPRTLGARLWSPAGPNDDYFVGGLIGEPPPPELEPAEFELEPLFDEPDDEDDDGETPPPLDALPLLAELTPPPEWLDDGERDASDAPREMLPPPELPPEYPDTPLALPRYDGSRGGLYALGSLVDPRVAQPRLFASAGWPRNAARPELSPLPSSRAWRSTIC